MSVVDLRLLEYVFYGYVAFHGWIKTVLSDVFCTKSVGHPRKYFTTSDLKWGKKITKQECGASESSFFYVLSCITIIVLFVTVC